MTVLLDQVAPTAEAATAAPVRSVTTVIHPRRPGWPALRQIRERGTLRWECSCGTPLGTSRRQARDVFGFHAPVWCPDGPRLPY